MLPVITYLDLETTGATPLKDRITEIGLVRVENGVEVARWQTLVNPQQTIPPFIQDLTGIDNDMVKDAPTFAEVAEQLKSYLEGAVLAAHNVRFDLGFLKSEYKRLDQTLRQPVLCTVKLSRQLYPQYPKHGLSVIMERHNLTTDMRHRAMGDVELMMGFVEVAKQELGIKKLKEVANKILKKASTPKGMSPALFDDLPESSGVYLFYGENQQPLFVGKSKNIRDQVLAHFNSDNLSSKDIKLAQTIKQIDHIETVGELGALLLESRLIKAHQPTHNRQLSNDRQLCSWKIAKEPDAKPLVSLVHQEEITPENFDDLFGTFKSKKQATEALKHIATDAQLCLKLLGLESGSGACLASQSKDCNGICISKADTKIHHLKLQQALAKHRMKNWPYPHKITIKEHNKFTGNTDIHVFDQWCHIGTVSNEGDYHEMLAAKTVFSFDLGTYKLLLKTISSGKYEVIEA